MHISAKYSKSLCRAVAWLHVITAITALIVGVSAALAT
jgi:hypothetical protein